MIGNEYSQDFQIKLLINLVLDPKLFESTMGQLRIEDFGMPACRLIYEAARNYYAQYKRLPPFSTLETEVIRTMNDMTGTVLTKLAPQDFESLAVIMGWIANTRPADLDPNYYSARLPGFIAFVRLSILQGQQDFSTATDFITSVSNLNSQLAGIGSTQYEFLDAMTPIPDEMGSARPRIGWGVQPIDLRLGGGLTRQQSGLITACTGVGKTTTMLGIETYAAMHGIHSLFITCELPKFKILERAQMMLAGIEAKWFKVPKTQWPPHIRARWNIIASSESPIPGSVTIIEKIGNCTVFEIDRIIYNWKDHIARQGKNADQCAVVCVDWLDRIDPTGIKRMSKDLSDERANFHVLEHLDEFKVKHNVVLWTATQAGKSGEGKEVLTRKDTSWGQSKHYLMDASIGVAPKAPGKEDVDITQEFVSDPAHPNEDNSLGKTFIEPPCDRELIISFMKVRDGSAVGQRATVYQGPTLRLWNNRAQAETAAGYAEKGDVNGMINETLGTKLKGHTNAQPGTTGGIASR